MKRAEFHSTESRQTSLGSSFQEQNCVKFIRACHRPGNVHPVGIFTIQTNYHFKYPADIFDKNDLHSEKIFLLLRACIVFDDMLEFFVCVVWSQFFYINIASTTQKHGVPTLHHAAPK